jgi:hypothetical protein
MMENLISLAIGGGTLLLLVVCGAYKVADAARWKRERR